MSKERKNVMNLIIQNVQNECSALSVKIHKGSQKISEEQNAKGTLYGSFHIESIKNLLLTEIEQTFNKIVQGVDALQSELNIKLTNTEIDKVGKLVSEHYKSINQNCNEILDRWDKTNTNEIFSNLLEQNETQFVHKKLEEIKLKNKEKKDSPAIQLAKRANIISIAAIIISIIAIIVSAYVTLITKKCP
jgi:hypothetical protein